MLNLTIKDKVYPFSFGVGFVRKISPRETEVVNGRKVEVGVQFAIAAAIDRDVLALVDVLLIANEMTDGEKVTKKLLDFYFDEECTDLDALCDEILDFFEHTNATKKAYKNVQELLAAQKAKAEQQKKAESEQK